MRYTVDFFSSREKENLVLDLKKFLDSLGFVEVSPDDAEYVFVVGGDGSFIHFSKKYAFTNKKLIGIRAGNTSFLSNLKIQDLEHMNSFSWGSMPFLSFQGKNKMHFAVNDIYISGNLFLESEIYIDGVLLETFRGSGILISSKNGSTGKSKSMHGSILLYDDLWLFKEIGPFNTVKANSLNSSLVLSSSNNLKIRISESVGSRIYIDGKELLEDIKELNISLVRGSLNIVSFSLSEYVKKLRETFLISNV